MNREEILEKSRKEKIDEGMISAENRGRKIGFCVFCAIFVFIMVFNLLNGQPSFGPKSMFWAFVAAEAYPKYCFTKNKTFLVTTIAGSIASAASLTSFVISVIR